MIKNKLLSRAFIAFTFLFAFSSCQKTEDPVDDSCPEISLTVEHSFNLNELGYTVLKIVETETGEYYASAAVESSLDYLMLKMDANFNVVDEFLMESEKLVDFIVLSDGRVVVSSANELGQLGIISADFTTMERFENEFQTWPTLFDCGDGFIAADASGVYSLKLYKYTYDFEEIWVRYFGPSNPQSYYFTPDQTKLYITTVVNDIHIIDTESGETMQSYVFKPGRQLFQVYAEDDAIYMVGSEGPTSECKQDIWAARIDAAGNQVWHLLYGSTDSDDWGNHIIKHNNKVYVSGSYARSCTPTAFGGYHNYYLLELDPANGAISHCYLDQEFSFGMADYCFVNQAGELISVGTFTNSEMQSDERRVLRVE